jgi:hypothetical protein
LEAEFELSDAQPLDGLEWIYAKPRNKDSSLSNVRVGLKGNILVTLDIVDRFGQRSVLQFSAFEANPALDASVFQFKPPAGVDVFGSKAPAMAALICLFTRHVQALIPAASTGRTPAPQDLGRGDRAAAHPGPGHGAAPGF